MFLDKEGKKFPSPKVMVLASINGKSTHLLKVWLTTCISRLARQKSFILALFRKVSMNILCMPIILTNTEQEKLEPCAYVHNFSVPQYNLNDFTYGLLLDIASACNPADKTVLLGFVQSMHPIWIAAKVLLYLTCELCYELLYRLCFAE